MEWVEEAIRLRSEGMSWRELGRRFNKHPYAIQFYLMTHHGFEKTGKVGKDYSWDVQKGVEMRKAGMTYRAIAKEFGLHPETVRRPIKARLEGEEE